MRLRYFGLLAPLCLAASLCAAEAKPAKAAASGSESASSGAPDFGSTWANNGSAYSLANLQGKVVVLYYFTVT